LVRAGHRSEGLTEGKETKKSGGSFPSSFPPSLPSLTSVENPSPASLLTLKIYEGAPHGIWTTLKDRVNAELLGFIKS
jgi:hypothetical protein